MNGTAIIWPMTVQALVSLWLYVPMSRARLASVKRGKAKASDFRLPDVDEQPETRQLANAVANQFELPVLFFTVCLAALAIGSVGWVLTVLAWIFVLSKTVHSCIHATSNRLRYRRPVFMVAWGACILMWVWFAASALFGR